MVFLWFKHSPELVNFQVTVTDPAFEHASDIARGAHNAAGARVFVRSDQSVDIMTNEARLVPLRIFALKYATLNIRYFRKCVQH